MYTRTSRANGCVVNEPGKVGSDVKIGRLLLRLIVGGYFIGHGTQKLFGWFGGHGLEGTGQFFEEPGSATRQAPRAGRRPERGRRRRAARARRGHPAGLSGADRRRCSPPSTESTSRTAPGSAMVVTSTTPVLIAAALALAETGPGSPSIDRRPAASLRQQGGASPPCCSDRGRRRRARVRGVAGRPRRADGPGSGARRRAGARRGLITHSFVGVAAGSRLRRSRPRRAPVITRPTRYAGLPASTW